MPRRLFHDDFGTLLVGPLPTDFSALGKYHHAPPAAPQSEQVLTRRPDTARQ